MTFLLPDGSTEIVDAVNGSSLMRVAVTHGIAGIEAECGGSLACGTCHVYIEQGLQGFPLPDAAESDMLEGVAADRMPSSRLSCQLTLAAEHEGLVVRIPATQS